MPLKHVTALIEQVWSIEQMLLTMDVGLLLLPPFCQKTVEKIGLQTS